MQNPPITLDVLQKLRILGEGTYGKCYLVSNKLDNKLYVLKQIQIFGMSEEEQEEVIKEARILSLLDHTFIVKFKTFFKNESYLNIVMQYADGGDLGKVIKQAKGVYFSENQILNWFTQICIAIKHIHDKKVIHRDLKCQNVFMTKQGTIKLGDFGISKHLSKTLEKIKTVVGTPYYMSPQICENKDYSLKTDIWSLGIILYEMCALKLPFEGNSLAVLALKISKGAYPPLPGDYSKQLKFLLKNLLQSIPAKRLSINKVLQSPLIAKRVQQYLPKQTIPRQLSLSDLGDRNLIEKQNDQEVFEESLKDNFLNRSDVDGQKKNEVHSARSHYPQQKMSKTPQGKNSEISTKLKDFVSNSKSGKIDREKEKKKKVESFKRRQISEPNLMMKKFLTKADLIQLKQEENQEKQEFLEDVQSTLRLLIKQKDKKYEQKMYKVANQGGLAGESFNGYGIISLLLSMQNNPKWH